MPHARVRLKPRSRPGGREAEPGKLFPGDLAVVPREGMVGEDDRLLVAFAGNENQIAGAGAPKCLGDGFAAIFDFKEVATAGPAGRDGMVADLPHDRSRVFAAGILVREDGEIGTGSDGAGDPGAAPRITFAGSADDDDEPPGADGAEHGQHLVDGVARVRVVDNHLEGLPRGDALHPSGHARARRQPPHDHIQAEAQGEAGRRGSERVGNVEDRRQGDARVGRPRGGNEPEVAADRTKADVAGLDLGVG